jgi:hypothetical protein
MTPVRLFAVLVVALTLVVTTAFFYVQAPGSNVTGGSTSALPNNSSIQSSTVSMSFSSSVLSSISSSTSNGPNEGLTITGKVTIVLCPEPAIVNASQCKGAPDLYSSRMLVLTSGEGSPAMIALNTDGSFTAVVPAGTYQVSIESCDFSGCNLPIPGSIVVATSQGGDYSICFNCK